MKDRVIEKLIQQELKRSNEVVNLIASENFTSQDVRQALTSEFGNKYAEGYPGKRYYKGNDVVDKIEQLCQQRALKLFSLDQRNWQVNVQPHSGSPANLAVYLALLPHDGIGKIMGMTLAHGGHLTHGHHVSATGMFWTQVPYGVSSKTELIDYEELAKIAKKEQPNIIVAGYSAYSRKIDWKRFRKIADSVGAYLMVDMSHIAGLVAGRVHDSPFPYADVVTTTTHKTLRGPRGAMIFSRIDKRDLPSKIDKAVFPGLQGGPHLHTVTAIAVALEEASKTSFKKYATQVVQNAKTLSEELVKLGWRIISGGTDNHLMLVDTWANGISGRDAATLLEQKNIVVNMNTIPFDTRKPSDPSGIRLGTAYMTTKGAKKKEMLQYARMINAILRNQNG